MPMTEFSVTVSSSNRGFGVSFTAAGVTSSGGGGGGGGSVIGVDVGAGTGAAGGSVGAVDEHGAEEPTAGGFAVCGGRAFASDRPELMDLDFGASGSLAGDSAAGSAGTGTVGAGVAAGDGTAAVVQAAGASAPRVGALMRIA